MRLFGHPVHPMLVHFPIALWSLASIGDVLAALGFSEVRPFAWSAMGLGLCLAVPAMILGLLDFRTVDDRAEPVAMRHMALMGVAWIVYLAAFVMGTDGFAPRAPQSGIAATLVSVAGFILMAVGAKLGGTLVYGFGVGVSPERTGR